MSVYDTGGTVLSAAFTGLSLGFLVAMPLGPIGLLCLRSVVRFGFRVGVAIGTGAAFVDAIYAAPGSLGAGQLLRATGLGSVLGILGGLVLVYLGMKTVWTAHRVRSGFESDGEVLRPLAAMRTALIATASNPATIAYWAAAFAAASATAVTTTTAASVAMLAGVALGTLSWFCLLSAVAAVFARRAGARTRAAADAVAGVGLISFGGLLTYRSLPHHS